MELLSLTGVVLGIALFMALAFKGINILLSALASSVLIAVLSSMPVLPTITDTWSTAFSSFLKGYFLIFVLSSLFGKTMGDGKASRSIAMSFSRLVLKSKKHKKLFALLFVPIMYSVLSYAGVSGYVIVFTVLFIGRDLYQECDIPWRFYCYGGASTIGTAILGGNLQITNILLSDLFKTGLTAAMLLSVIGALTFYITLIILVVFDLRKSEKAGEHFADSGAGILSSEVHDSKEELPNILLSFVPMIAVVFISVAFSQVIIGLLVGTLLNIILFRKYMGPVKESVAAGINNGIAPVINLAATVGLSSILAMSPGFGLVTNLFGKLPPVMGGVSLIALFSFLVASNTAAYPAFGERVFQNMVDSGVTAGAAHRVMAASIFTCVGPHSPATVNLAALAKMEYKKAAWMLFKATIVPGFVALTVMCICIRLGLMR